MCVTVCDPQTRQDVVVQQDYPYERLQRSCSCNRCSSIAVIEDDDDDIVSIFFDSEVIDSCGNRPKLIRISVAFNSVQPPCRFDRKTGIDIDSRRKHALG